ncbi:PAS domain S-box protein [Emticicia fluvialis]|uniref:PAS domain S-box protein n=1 Tax=Emticicia fluvialis TaxID=2974474 RepID=UPI002165ABF4|nr:PAS domain S-box protein [Emticicia fluvialis]
MNNKTSTSESSFPGKNNPSSGEIPVNTIDNLDYRNLLENYIDENYLIVDRQLKIVKYNKGFKDLCFDFMGLEVKTGENILNYVLEGRTETIRKYYNRVFNGEQLDVELNLPSFKNKFISFNTRYKPIYNDQHQIIGAYVTSLNLSRLKKAELDKHQNEVIYQHMIDNSPDAFFLCTLEGKIMDANPAASDIFGYTYDELKRMHRNDLLLEFEEHASQFKDADMHGGKLKGVTIGIRKNGEEFPLEFSSVVYTDLYGLTKTSTFVSDISARKNAEKLLEQSERRFRALVENAGEIVMLTTENGKVIYASPALERVTGYTPDDINNDPGLAAATIYPDDVPQVTDTFRFIIQNPGIAKPVQYRLLHKNGHYIWLKGMMANMLHDANVGAIVANYRDISIRKQTEEKLARTEGRFKALVETGEDIIILVQPDGLITYVSPAFEKHTGFVSEEVIGHFNQEFMHPEQAAESPGLIAGLIANPGSTASRTNRLKCKDGSYIWVEGYVTNLLHDQNVQALVANFQDITTRLEAEERLSNSERDLKTIFENTTEAFLLMDTQRIVKAFNHNAIRVAQLNGDKELVIGVDLLDLAINTRCDLAKAAISRSLEGKTIKYDRCFERPNGDNLWFEYSLSPVYANGVIVGSCMTAREITDRKKAEEEISKREALFRSVFENSHDLLLLFDAEGKIEFMSPSFQKAFGFLKKHDNIELIREYLHPDDRQTAQDTLDKALANPEQPIDVILRKQAAVGGYSIIEGTFTNMLHKPEVNVVVANFKDITEQYRFKEQQALFVSIVNSSEDSILSMDLNKTILTWNPSAEKMFGFTAEEAIGQLTTIIIPDDRLHEETEILDRIRNGFPVKHYETLRKNKSGELLEISLTVSPIKDINGNITGASKIARDISDRKKSEILIRNSEKRFRSLLQNSSDGLSLLSADGIMLEISPAGKRITEFEEHEILGINLATLIHPEDIEVVSQAFLGILKDPSLTKRSEYRSLTKSGTFRWLEASFQNLLNEPAVGAVVVNYRDITDRKNQEIEREQLIKTLNQNNNDLRNFSYITSHNLKAPLSNLMGFLDLLTDIPIEDPTLSTILDGFKTSTIQLNNTVNDLVKILVIRDTSDIEQKEIGFERIFRQVASQLAPQVEEADAHIELKFQNAPTVIFNETYLESIFMNLLTNAIKYRSYDRPLKIEVATRKTDDGIVLTFADNGIGFDVERHKAKIFGLYQRFHDRPNSKGLGLYLIKSQMESLQGTISVASAEGIGTTFTLRFHA